MTDRPGIDMDQLLTGAAPCPFCGSSDVGVARNVVFRCKRCGAEGGYPRGKTPRTGRPSTQSIIAARAAWDRRYVSAPAKLDADELERGLRLLRANRDRDTGLTMGSDLDVAAWFLNYGEDLLETAKQFHRLSSAMAFLDRYTEGSGFSLYESSEYHKFRNVMTAARDLGWKDDHA